ncbi:MAG: T9SS type A sorting domain-containing protein, partial [Candidatus Marinimicrobia bacterium]|nr:T9SS type A sorting domain-containing protein [Candidatus Neomarinimicrobiota bacterium]
SDPPESWPLDLVGVVGWYNDPQMMPRYMADFLTNQAPADFLILNPADSAVISSFEDPNVEKIDMDGDSIYALFTNWEAAYDKEGDSLTYEMIFIGDGPEEKIITADTFLYIPLDQEEPYDMNGTYTYYYTATDPMGEMAYSDTNTLIFDFSAPPRVVAVDVVLMSGVPTYYAEFDLPLDEPAIANFSVLDMSAPAVLTPTAVDSIAPNAVMITAPMVEDSYVALVYTGLVTPGETVTVTDTTKGQMVYIPFSAAHPEDDALMIEDFEETIGAFKNLSYSGSTNGINETTSTFAPSDEAFYEGAKSAKIVVFDDPAVADGWFVRIPYDYASWAYNYRVKANSTIMLLLKGTASNVDIALTIKDTGYERMMWKSVSLCGTDWQVVSFDLANDEATGWITGDGVITPDASGTVAIGDIHISCDADEDATIYIDGFTERQVLSPVDITLSVMMHEWLRLDKFNLASDYVDVAGTFNGWDGSGNILGDLDSDTTYSVVVPMMPYSTQNFKFRINGSWSDATAEFPYGAPSRELVVPGVASEFTYWYNNDTLEVAIDGIPVEFALHQNYPNPFNPVTTINFDLPNITDVSLVIYDITGRKVRTLVSNSNIDAGYKKIVWNGRDDFGNGVATGMYIYRLVAGDFVDVKKMTFLK